MTATERYRCGACGRRRPAEDTALVPGHRHGNYRRASASAMRRVCRDCTVDTVTFVRQAQAEGRHTPLDDHHVQWGRAADLLGIDVADLWRTEYDRRRRAEAAAAPVCSCAEARRAREQAAAGREVGEPTFPPNDDGELVCAYCWEVLA